MNLTNILLPVLMQIVLTLCLFIILGARKNKAIKSGGVDRKKAALNNAAWPDDVVKVSNNIANQFQTPVLFYTLSMFFHVTNSVSTIVLALAWAYVISRVLHAYVHIGSNFVPARLRFFMVGALCLIVLTALALLSVVTS